MTHRNTAHKKTNRQRLHGLAGLLCLALLWIMFPLQAAADDERELVITVVEEIPAEEIEESEVPLAAFPNSGHRSGTRHLLLMSLTLAAVIAYVWYFTLYEKRLSLLRAEAARAERGWQAGRLRQRQERGAT